MLRGLSLCQLQRDAGTEAIWEEEGDNGELPVSPRTARLSGPAPISPASCWCFLGFGGWAGKGLFAAIARRSWSEQVDVGIAVSLEEWSCPETNVAGLAPVSVFESRPPASVIYLRQAGALSSSRTASNGAGCRR